MWLWVSNSDPLEEQQVVLTDESYLQISKCIFFYLFFFFCIFACQGVDVEVIVCDLGGGVFPGAWKRSKRLSTRTLPTEPSHQTMFSGS